MDRLVQAAAEAGWQDAQRQRACFAQGAYRGAAQRYCWCVWVGRRGGGGWGERGRASSPMAHVPSVCEEAVDQLDQALGGPRFAVDGGVNQLCRNHRHAPLGEDLFEHVPIDDLFVQRRLLAKRVQEKVLGLVQREDLCHQVAVAKLPADVFARLLRQSQPLEPFQNLPRGPGRVAARWAGDRGGWVGCVRACGGGGGGGGGKRCTCPDQSMQAGGDLRACARTID